MVEMPTDVTEQPQSARELHPVGSNSEPASIWHEGYDQVIPVRNDRRWEELHDPADYIMGPIDEIIGGIREGDLTWKMAFSGTTFGEVISEMFARYIDPDVLAREHLDNHFYQPQRGPNGELEAVVGPRGQEEFKFSNYNDGKPMTIEMREQGRLESQDGGKTYTHIRSGLHATMTDLTVDDRGNISASTEAPSKRFVTFTPDGYSLIDSNPAERP